MDVTNEQDIGQDEIADVVARLEAKANADGEKQEHDEPEAEPASDESGDEQPPGEEPPSDEATEKGESAEEAEEKEEEQPTSRRFAALARRESKLHRERQALQAERQRLDQERQALQQWAALPQIARENPLAALDALGLSYEQLTEAIIAGKNSSPQAQPVTRDDLTALKQELQKEREELEAQRQLEAFRREVADHIRQDADRYELINLQGKSNLVVEVIEEAYQQHGRLLDIDEAAKLVEEHLEQEALKVLSSKKLSAKRPSAKPQPKAKATPRRTIAGMGTSKGSLAPSDSSVDPDEEDFQRAISAYHKARAR